MNRNKLNSINEEFKKNENRLKSLKIGESIYEQELQDPFGGSYFEHKVVSVDLEEMCVNTLDLSYKNFYKDGKPSKLYGFYTKEEANL
jgi:hypothetical protein